MTESEGMTDAVLRGYAEAAAGLVARFEAVSSAALYAPVADLLPAPPARIADIGAGSGRDAAWLARRGHRVVAVEPVEAFRRAGEARHQALSIEWLDDRLPELARLRDRGDRFDCLLLSAVWQHLDDGQRRCALPGLAALTTPGGRVILSLRHGPGAAERPVHEARPEATIEAARQAGLTLLRRCRAESAQAANRAAGVHWTWLVFERR